MGGRGLNEFLGFLPDLQRVLILPRGSTPPIAGNSGDIGALSRSLYRKASFAEHHMAVLAGIDWEKLETLGRRAPGASMPEQLSISLPDALLVILHPSAAVDYAYLAFDGLTSAISNMTDTFGRLVNSAYALGISPRQASLFAVRDQCAVTSHLGSVLHDAARTEWLRKIRALRGRCQHADVESVLMTEPGPYAQRRQPIVDASYCWAAPFRGQPVVEYARASLQAAEKCLVSAVEAILRAPQNPVS